MGLRRTLQVGLSVDALAEDVRVAGVPGALLEHVRDDQPRMITGRR